MRTHYSAKLLLFGEYTIILGGEALALPLKQFGGRWAQGKAAATFPDLRPFIDYLAAEQLLPAESIAGFRDAVQQGLYFQSDIPAGYGLGSSGALCAAVYDRFKPSNPTKPRLKQARTELAKMERFFHGSSSGIDPLICWLNAPVWIQQNRLDQVSLPQAANSLSLFLVDTGQPRSTSPLVQKFMAACESPVYRQAIVDQLMLYNQQAITNLLHGNYLALWSDIQNISTFQWQYFMDMIPFNMRPLWEKGIECDNFRLKLCGAGGGGFMLGFSTDFTQTQQHLVDYNFTEIDLRN